MSRLQPAMWRYGIITYLLAGLFYSSLLPILGGGLKHLWFSPSFGEDEPILTHIFSDGLVKNHQLDCL